MKKHGGASLAVRLTPCMAPATEQDMHRGRSGGETGSRIRCAAEMLPYSFSLLERGSEPDVCSPPAHGRAFRWGRIIARLRCGTTQQSILNWSQILGHSLLPSGVQLPWKVGNSP